MRSQESTCRNLYYNWPTNQRLCFPFVLFFSLDAGQLKHRIADRYLMSFHYCPRSLLPSDNSTYYNSIRVQLPASETIPPLIQHYALCTHLLFLLLSFQGGLPEKLAPSLPHPSLKAKAFQETSATLAWLRSFFCKKLCSCQGHIDGNCGQLPQTTQHLYYCPPTPSKGHWTCTSPRG